MVPDGEGIFYCEIIMRPRKNLLSARSGWPQIPVHMRRATDRGRLWVLRPKSGIDLLGKTALTCR